MTVKELIEKLQTMPQDARVQMGYDGNFVSTEPTGDVFVVQSDDNFLYADPGDVFIEGK
jgi:hypothetical protein